MSAYDIINKQLNDEMQSLAELIKSGEYTERDRNRLASIMYPKLKYFIWKFFNNADETEEVLHNTLYKIFKGITSYSDNYRFTTWIYTIAKNEALLHQHKLKVQYATSIDNLAKPLNLVDDSINTFEKEIYLDHLYTMTREELSNLPDCLEKSILIDKELNQMRGNEIAEKYDMNLNTVKTKIRKARRMLKDAVITRNPDTTDRLKEYF
jgi:RNA polymerase sigma-70 factor (ECF subfamily)